MTISMRLKPDTYCNMRYLVPRDGKVCIYVSADDYPVNVYVFDADGMNEFLEGEAAPKSYYYKEARVHSTVIEFPFEGSWFLVISNPQSDREVNIRYDARCKL